MSAMINFFFHSLRLIRLPMSLLIYSAIAQAINPIVKKTAQKTTVQKIIVTILPHSITDVSTVIFKILFYVITNSITDLV